MCNNVQNNELIDKFTLPQKFLMGLLFWSILIIGVYSIFVEDFFWGVVYSIYLFVFPFNLLGFAFCSHCPYPCEHSTCLFLPYQLPKKVYKYKPTPMTTLDKTVTLISFLPISIVPLLWLYKSTYLLVPFIIANVALYAGFFFYFCKRCRNYACPINRVKN